MNTINNNPNSDNQDEEFNFDGMEETLHHLHLMENEGWYQIRDENDENWLVPPNYGWNEAAKEKRIRL